MNIKESLVFTNIKGKNILHSNNYNISSSIEPSDYTIKENLILNNSIKSNEDIT
ncbi:hypothetical protein [Clostridium intestinale]|uniref:Uncharacterized protein n=1 Tax=Clostridium intestinale TaxID=36845 RepID=A0A7D6VQK7_9CLOT|nr:hypothetical protein [Clostridium intestinale]QLY79569.1 hypothetical protein HZF06_21450 [Clostridium intestinale]